MTNNASGQGWAARLRRYWSDPVGSKLIADGIKALWLLVVVPVCIVAWKLGPRMWAAISSPEWWSAVHDRRQIAIWLILPATLALVAVWRLGRMRGYKAGHVAGARAALTTVEGTGPTEVLAFDRRCGLFWRVKFPLHEIQSLDVDGSSPGYLRSIVDGPFHMKKDCHERMQLEAYDGGDGFSMVYLCRHCDKGGEADLRPVAESTIARSVGEVILELQRLARQSGGALEADEGRIQLQRPLYWERVDARRPRT